MYLGRCKIDNLFLRVGLDFWTNYKYPHALPKGLVLSSLKYLTNWDQQDGPVVTFQRAIYSGLLNLTNDGGHYRGSAAQWEKENYHSKGGIALTTHKY